MLSVSLAALLLTLGAAPKKKKPPPQPPPPAQVEPAKPAPEPEPAKPEPAPEAAPEPAPAKPAPEPVKPVEAAQPSNEMKPASAVETTKPKLVVLEVTPGGGIDPTIAAALGDAITLEVARRGFFTPTSMKELQTMLGVERQRQLMGCSDASASSCMAELADAIGARFVLSGALTRLGDAYQLSLQTIDTAKAQPIGRSVRIAKDPSTLTEQVPFAVAEATATALPAPPSRVLPYSLIIGGGVFALVGGIVFLDAFSRDRAVQQELESAELNPNLLRSMASYRTDADDIRAKKIISLTAVVLGAALVVGGVLLMPSSSSSSGAQVALVPTGDGAAIVGVFP